MKDYSQNGESKILEEILPEKGFFVDLGAGDGYHLSNTRYFKDKGWDGLMVDADPKDNEEVCGSFITKENIIFLLGINDVPLEFDLLSLDLDGNDYWILNEILPAYHPKTICFEINSQLPLVRSWVMPYDPDHKWDGTSAYGMSYMAAFKLCEKYGYEIYDIVNSANIIATRLDVQPKKFSIHPTYSHPIKEINWKNV